MATTNYLSEAGLTRYNDNIKATYATKTAVASDIADAIAGVTQFDYKIVESLPAEGVKGTIYLITNTGSGSNVYDEYLWIGDKFELFGTKELEITEYIGGEKVTITDGTGANAGKKVVDLTQSAAQTLDSALQSVTSTGNTVVVTGDGTTKNVEVSDTIKDGAAAGATALQSVSSTGNTVVVTGDGTTKNLEVSSTIVDGAAAGATALQPADIAAISNETIDALFA